MKGPIRNKKLLVRGREVFIRLDVHKESWHVSFRVEEFNTRVINDNE